MFSAPKLRSLAAISGAVAAIGVASPANAFVYSLSHLEIADLAIAVTGTTTTVNSFTFNLSNSASMNSGPVASSAACGTFGPACSGVSPVLNAAAVNAPASTLLRTNESTFLGTGGPADSYSGADSVIKTAQLVQGVPTSTEQIAESLLNTNGFAQANALIQSNTSLSWQVTLGGSADLALSFMADPDQRAQIAGLPGVYLSQSDINATFTIAGGGGSVSWTPNGTGLANDCVVAGSFIGVVTCTETADSEDLNFNAAASLNPETDDNSYDVAQMLTAFGINVEDLPGGTFTVTLNANTSTSIGRQVVPEPATLGLVGLALLGAGFVGARNRKAVK